MSGNKRVLGSDLDKIDAHVVTAEEYQEIPELTAEWFQAADHFVGDKLVRRGRPKAAVTKQAISLRLDPEVVEAFRKTGSGWQSRVNDALRRHLKLRA